MEIITDKGEYFEIPADFSLDIEFINPLLDNIGSQSTPGTLPYTPYNLKILNFPNRMDRARKYQIKRDITLREGLFQRQATQVIFKANEKDKIVSTFYFDEAIFYEKMKNLKLADINYGPVRSMDVKELFQLCNDVMFNRREDDFVLFPVIIGYDGTNKISFQEADWINKISIDPVTSNAALTDRSLTQIEMDGTLVSVPPGYGVSPFPKLSFIIRKIIEHIGYVCEYNVFETDPDLKQLVIVNNIIDAIVDGKIDFSQLLPDMTVSDFILKTGNKFGIKFFCDEVKKSIITVVADDILKQAPDYNLTPYLTGNPAIEWSENKQLKLISGTTIKCAKPETDSYSEMVQKYGPPIDTDKRMAQRERLEHDQLYYVKNENIYYFDRAIYADGRFRGSIRTRLSPYFNRIPKEKEIVEMDAGDEQLPVFFGSIVAYDGDKGYAHYYVAPGVNESRNIKTTLVKDGEKETDNFDSVGGSGNDMPLMYCFKVPALQQAFGNGRPYVPMGTTGRYDMAGQPWGNLSLNISGNNGLYERFWKNYDKMVSDSNQTIRCNMNLPLHVLQNLKIYTPKLLFNQPVLIERIKCKIGKGKCEVTEAVFRTLRAYED